MKLLHTALFVSLTARSVSAAWVIGQATLFISSPSGRPRFRLLPGRPAIGRHVLRTRNYGQEHQRCMPSVAGQGHRTTAVVLQRRDDATATTVVR